MQSTSSQSNVKVSQSRSALEGQVCEYFMTFTCLTSQIQKLDPSSPGEWKAFAMLHLRSNIDSSESVPSE
ncbi:hypothetical protein RRG08_009413 [Elysia crispata]|uniref:Uncharacterized protein n=1 Tax=Elysia crispata TaxID=231223 RepID=A0AAE0Y8J6_9GAST|nr:hypothetical protein RRG08_009413 [Elysia crispata]